MGGNVVAYKILVVDDEKLIVKGIKFSLEPDGMTVDAAYDGEEALNLIKTGTVSYTHLHYDSLIANYLSKQAGLDGFLDTLSPVSYTHLSRAMDTQNQEENYLSWNLLKKYLKDEYNFLWIS